MAGSYKLVVKQGGVGDCLNASGLVRDLHARDPDTRLSVVGSGSSDLFRYDPRVRAAPDPAAVEVVLDYRATYRRARTDRAARYAYAPHDAFEAATGLCVARGPARPSYVRGPDESPPVSAAAGPYAVLAAGTKCDIPLKAWPYAHFGRLVALLPEYRWVQVGALADQHAAHRQTAVPGCMNLLGKTDLRQMMAVIGGAALVVCHMSLPLLAASALRVPCVAIAGGREDPWLFHDMGVTVLDAVGALPCCDTGGCWRIAVRNPHAESNFPPNWACELPAQVGPQWVGRCMADTPPELVAAACRLAVAAA